MQDTQSDVVVSWMLLVWCSSPTDPGNYMIKRVVATEGETVL